MHRSLCGSNSRVLILSASAALAVVGLLGAHGLATAQDAQASVEGLELVSSSAGVDDWGRPSALPIGPSGRISGSIIVPYPIFPFPCPKWPPVPPPPGVPTPGPRPTPTPGPATGLTYGVCPQILNRVPTQVQQDALATPWEVYGYGMRLNPSVPYHPLWNPYRTHLTLLDYGKPWHPCNPVVWKTGCP